MIAIAVDTPSQLVAGLLAYQRIGRGKPVILFGRHGLETRGRHPSIQRMLFYGEENRTPSRLLSGLMSPLTLLRTIPGFDASIDIEGIITSRTAFVSTYLNKEYSKRHVFLPLYLVESGPGDYFEENPKDKFMAMCAMMHEPTHMDFISRGFVAAPELFPFDPPYPVESLPDPDLETGQVLGPMLGRPPKDERADLMARGCIFIETSRQSKDDFEAHARDVRALSAVVRAIGAQNVSVVQRGQRDIPYEQGLSVMTLSLPIESFFYRCNFSSKILVCADLEPLTAPSLFFRQEPWIIYTGDLDGETARPGAREFFLKFAKRYQHPDRCAAPLTLMELRETLKDFHARLEDSTTNK